MVRVLTKCFLTMLIITMIIWFAGFYSFARESVIENYDTAAKVENTSDKIDEIMDSNDLDSNVSMKELYKLLLSGKVDEVINLAVTNICTNVTFDMIKNKEIISQLILLVIIAAVFSNYSSVLKFSYVGEQGFYITYLMSAVLLLKSFMIIYELTEQTIVYIKEMMECMLPALSMSLIMCSGITSSQMTNSALIWMLSLMERLILNALLPAVRIYFLIVLLNQISGKDRFSKLAALIKQSVEWILKALIAGVTGMNVVKSLIAPIYDNVRFNTLQKGISLLPGGSNFTGLSSIFIGTAVLIKNSIGVAGAVMLIMAGMVPMVKILVFYISYRLVLAFTQPISDSRITSGIEGACLSTEILLRLTAASVGLCVLSIAVVLLSTNVRFFAG